MKGTKYHVRTLRPWWPLWVGEAHGVTHLPERKPSGLLLDLQPVSFDLCPPIRRYGLSMDSARRRATEAAKRADTGRGRRLGAEHIAIPREPL